MDKKIAHQAEDFSWIEMMHEKYRGYEDYILEKIEKGYEIYLFGFGGFGQMTADRLLAHDIDIARFVDNDEKKSGKQYKGIECISFQRFLEKRGNVFLIVAAGMPLSMIGQLNALGIDNYDVMVSPYKLDFDNVLRGMEGCEVSQKLRTVSSLLEDEKSRKVLKNIVKSWYDIFYEKDLFLEIYEDNQYFCKDIIRLNEDTVFADCGAFVGDSLQTFLRNIPDEKFAKAILFELNGDACDKLQENINRWCSPDAAGRIAVINKGVSDKNAEFLYSASGSSSNIQGGMMEQESQMENMQRAQIVRIDDELTDGRVSLIKMDIEGCEAAAIAGAENLIKKCKPDLAICVYHRISDMWEIPFLIRSFVPEYKFYLRHHSNMQIETVLYAVCEKN